MASMRDIKRRIRSIQSTQQITKAMKTVSAAKLRKTQTNLLAARPYSDKLAETASRLLGEIGNYENALFEQRTGNRVAYLIMTGDRGLAGGFNANIIRTVEQILKNETDDDGVIIALGRKGRDYFRRRNYEILQEYLDLGDDPHYIQARELAREMVNLFLEGKADKINLVYTHFYSAIRHEPEVKQFLPLEGISIEEKGEETDYIYEPSKREVLDHLIPRSLEVAMYRALLESKASEHGARMAAMDAASNNAGEMIDQLTLSFNRARQAAITREISEIVGGAAALS
ncbi:MAG: ATP synthase F1 subunit gamma [Bacillota bacterium]